MNQGFHFGIFSLFIAKIKKKDTIQGKPKFKTKVISLALGLALTLPIQSGRSECIHLYQEEIKKLETSLEDTFGCFIFLSILTCGLALPLWGPFIIPKKIRLQELKDALQLIFETQISHGEVIFKLYSEVTRPKDVISNQLSIRQVSDLIVTANEKDLYCTNGRLFTYSLIQKGIRSGLTQEALDFPPAYLQEVRQSD